LNRVKHSSDHRGDIYGSIDVCSNIGYTAYAVLLCSHLRGRNFLTRFHGGADNFYAICKYFISKSSKYLHHRLNRRRRDIMGGRPSHTPPRPPQRSDVFCVNSADHLHPCTTLPPGRISLRRSVCPEAVQMFQKVQVPSAVDLLFTGIPRHGLPPRNGRRRGVPDGSKE